ncbi:TPA: DUF354 domain-containing protein [archaeon]|jgi:predicted glycosyltransferase|uniref:DUF354 domain-containing protein n=1 Tax=Candidatus Undinarchaeum marinum TaxID=2756141 RepID=A0A832XIN2_9ARCH|nr:DUF354 domain-containing protein [Candidatus Undinarchaeum marinum]
MKVWIDLLTPKQVMLYSKLIPMLEKSGEEVFVTTRDYKETSELLQTKRIEAVVVGKHGGASLEGKLSASIERMREMKGIVAKESPNIALSLSSPEAARVAFGLGIPHICINDIPEATAQSRLSVPLSEKIVAPKLIPKEVWAKYGMPPERVVQYDALDPVAWLRDFKPSDEVLNILELKNEKIITFRTSETNAAYLNESSNGEKVLIKPMIVEMSESFPDHRIVVLARYQEQADEIRNMRAKRVLVPDKVVDAQSLIYHSDLFIGGGGTMTLESALLGTPTLACRPMRTFYEDYVIEKQLVSRTTKEDLFEQASDLIKRNGEHKRRQRKIAGKMIRSMEDPAEVIANTVRSTAI